jgi:hypothetical protein
MNVELSPDVDRADSQPEDDERVWAGADRAARPLGDDETAVAADRLVCCA